MPTELIRQCFGTNDVSLCVCDLPPGMLIEELQRDGPEEQYTKQAPESQPTFQSWLGDRVAAAAALRLLHHTA